jgi:hypothetical protein
MVPCSKKGLSNLDTFWCEYIGEIRSTTAKAEVGKILVCAVCSADSYLEPCPVRHATRYFLSSCVAHSPLRNHRQLLCRPTDRVTADSTFQTSPSYIGVSDSVHHLLSVQISRHRVDLLSLRRSGRVHSQEGGRDGQRCWVTIKSSLMYGSVVFHSYHDKRRGAYSLSYWTYVSLEADVHQRGQLNFEFSEGSQVSTCGFVAQTRYCILWDNRSKLIPSVSVY